tara:strand:- start:540 stop:761 length:222 start_codon:yes stop_codon:yes gene_type:complete
MAIAELGLPLWAIIVIYLIVIWAAIWKLIALWKAGRNNQLTWFIVLALLNTMSILPIVYLTWFQKEKKTSKKK